MSGAMMMLLGSGGGRLVSANPNCFLITAVDPEIHFKPDGRIFDRANDGTLVADATTWYDPLTASIGYSYWIKTLVTGGNGTATGLNSGVWYSLGSECYWGMSAAAISQLKGLNLNYYIATDSGGTYVVSNGSLQLTSSR